MKDLLWDPIRLIWVEPTPEERVRQHWILRLIQELGFPKGLLAVEKEISLFVKGRSIDRRVDLLAFRKIGEEMAPLLLIECKAGSLAQGAESQALGYNDLIHAPFVALVNGFEAKTLWREQGRLSSVPFIPSYQQLIATL